MMTIVLLIAIGAVVLAAYISYASVVTRKNKVAEALAGVDVQLTQRHDLIPNVLAIAKRFMEHEHRLLEDITALRAKASQPLAASDPAAATAEKFATESRLGAQVGRLFAVAEGYPQLKSDAAMVQAQRTYQEVETNIAAARRYYNANVTELRNAIQILPGSLFAGLAGVSTPPPYFEAAAGDRAPVDAVSLL